MQSLIHSIYKFRPSCEQELEDKALILEEIDQKKEQILYRTCKLFHMTASAIVINKNYNKLLLVHHNIYKSWAWIGGHADGISNLLSVARREIEEECGAIHIKEDSNQIISIDILTTKAHRRNNIFVPSHLHFNLSYLFFVEEQDILRVKEDENSAVAWVKISEVDDYITDSEMKTVIQKIIKTFK